MCIVARGRGAQAVACFCCESGLDPVAARIGFDQFVGIGQSELLFLARKSYRNRALPGRKPLVRFLKGVELARHHCYIICAGIVPCHRQPVGIDKMRVPHAELRRPFIHALNKDFFAARDKLAERNTAIIGAGHRHALHQLCDRMCLTRFHIHLAAAHRGRPLRDRDNRPA